MASSGWYGTILRDWRRLWRGQLTLAVLPFALLANSSAVKLTLTVEPDGSARRQVSVIAAPYFADQLPKWVKGVRLGSQSAWDMTWVQKGEKDLFYGRDARVSNLEGLGEEASYTYTDVCQNPLSLFTTYHWKETVSFEYLYDQDAPAARAVGKQLQYEVKMPGTVVQASVQPNQGSSATSKGRTALFKLDAGGGQQTLEVEARSLRWGYLLVVLYVLSYAGYRIGRLVGHQLRIRPRKI